MIKVKRTSLFLFLLFIVAVPSYAGLDQEKTYERAYIEWKPAEGALSYTVEIMDIYDDLILRKTTESVKLEVSLPYGKYKYRVGMLTKFNKISGWSEWRTLMIVPALEPKILSATPAGLSAGTGNRVTIKGKNFYRSSEVIIKNADTELEVKNVKLVDPETLSVTVDAAGAKPGTKYDLVVKNPGDLLDLESVAAKQFTITEKPPGPPLEFYLGLETGYYSPNLGKKDAYSGSFGVKLFTEFRSLGKSHPALSFLNKAPGFYPGVLLSVFGLLKPKSGFGSSSMLQLGFYFGYEFSFPLKGELQWHVSPMLGYKQYFRWHTYGGSDYFGTKPILLIGGNVTFDLPMKFFVGLDLEYNAIFDLKPANVIGVFVRCGYRL
jgi:hypothetical protein